MKLFLLAILTVVGAQLDPRQSVFQGKNLRILPLGASITWGKGSSDGNGYRQDLRNLLSPAEVTYIGTQCSGDMQNGNNEGHPKYHIDQLENKAAPDMVLQPNVVLIYAGTNDMLSKKASAAAPDHMQQLVRYLVTNLPHALIVVSKLFVDLRPQVAERIGIFDSQLNVTGLGNVMIADMSNLLTAADLGHDGEHPNDNGYTKMAQKFFSVLSQAEKEGKIADPVPIPYIPLCNGSPFLATSSSLGSTQPIAISTTSIAKSQASSSMPSPDTNPTTDMIPSSSKISSTSALGASQTALPSSQVSVPASTAQETSIISETQSMAMSTSSTSASPLVTQAPASSGHKLTQNSYTDILLLVSSVLLALRFWQP